MNTQDKKFDANFTAGGLLLNEFKALESMLRSENFGEEIKDEIKNNSVIGITTMSARKRIIAEINRRYSVAPIGFWDYFFQWNEQEMKFGLLYLCLKTYPIVMDIHIEVAIKKFVTGNIMNAYDIQMRLDEIASKYEYVSKWSNVTLEKINIQYRKIIKDAGLYDGKNLMTPLNISPTFWNYFEELQQSWFITACFIKN
jgi:hypothetical protein